MFTCKIVSTCGFVFGNFKTFDANFLIYLSDDCGRAARYYRRVTNFVRRLKEITRLGHLFTLLFVLA